MHHMFSWVCRHARIGCVHGFPTDLTCCSCSHVLLCTPMCCLQVPGGKKPQAQKGAAAPAAAAAPEPAKGGKGKKK